MCASSQFFLKNLVQDGVVRELVFQKPIIVFHWKLFGFFSKANKNLESLDIEMHPHVFEAYLTFIYDGYTIIDEEDLIHFQQALEVILF